MQEQGAGRKTGPTSIVFGQVELLELWQRRFMTAETEQTLAPKRRWLAFSALALIVIGALSVIFLRRRRAQAAKVAGQDSGRMPLITAATGLSEADAEARRQPDVDNVLFRRPRRTRRQIIRENSFTIFNLNLIALAAVQVLMESIGGALITLGVLLLNVGLNVFQEEFARYRLRDLLAAARPQATVIRGGKVRSIDPSDIVIGDILASGPGDQILVDGIIAGDGAIVVEEHLYGAELQRLRKREGDKLFAGSICTSGHAIYEVTATGAQRQIVRHMRTADEAEERLTPIEQIMAHVMRILLVVVLFLGAMLLLRYFRLDGGTVSDFYADAANVIFNVAPASLFFMVVLTYVAATADLGKIGALVQDSRSVESLAAVDTICFAKEGILTGTNVEFRAAAEEGAAQPLAESRIRQILGTCAHSDIGSNPLLKAAAAAFPGERRVAVEAAAYLSVYGWSGIVFDDEDLRGVYILAGPEQFAAHQAQQDTEREPQEKESILKRGTSSLTRPLGRLFRRGRNEEDQESDLESAAEEAGTPAVETGDREPHSEPEQEPEKKSVGLFGRLRRRAGSLLPGHKEDAPNAEDEAEEEPPQESVQLVFAYLPEIASLTNRAGVPKLPSGLVSLGTLTFLEQIHPDALPALVQFAEREVAVDIFSSGPAQKTIDMLAEAGLAAARENQIPSISGSDLAALDGADLTRAALDNRVFGQVSPLQTEQIVRILRREKRVVGVVADSAGDVNMLRQGDLAITRGSSSPAALSQADIILVGDSPAILSAVVDKGQRIVNGLLDVLKLYLTQAVYLVLLLIGIPRLIDGFPYTSAQAGMIAFFTLTLPAVGLSIWAKPGRLHKSTLRQVLARFVIPAALTMAAAGMIVYAYFLEQDGSLQYAQIALMHLIIAMGLMLVIYIQPPLILSRNRMPRLGNLPLTLIVLISAALFYLATQLPRISELLGLDPLREPAHYAIILWSALLWAVVLRIVWLVLPIERAETEGERSIRVTSKS